MTRKEILLFQLKEIRNEFADALADLNQEQLANKYIGDHNTIGWIACHCLNTFDFFIHSYLTTKSLMFENEEYMTFCVYASSPPNEDNPAPDFSGLNDAVNHIFSKCIDLIEALDEDALGKPAPYWEHEDLEFTDGKCVRVINHSNAHLRQIWMLRGAFGDKDHWPVQMLVKDEQGKFFVPDREKILADRG